MTALEPSGKILQMLQVGFERKILEAMELCRVFHDRRALQATLRVLKPVSFPFLKLVRSLPKVNIDSFWV